MAQANSYNVSTIKPSGGDYTSLATWWASEKGGGAGTDVAAWAECYHGVNMGAVNITGAGYTPTAAYYTRIYAASGERHDGAEEGGGAYIDVTDAVAITIQEKYTRVEGIRIQVNSDTVASRAVYVLNVDGVVIDGVCVEVTGLNTVTSFVCASTSAATEYTVTIRNIILYGNNSATRANGIMTISYGAGGLTSIIQNCAVSQLSSHADSVGIRFNTDGSTNTVTSTNNIATGTGGDDFRESELGGGTVNVTQTYCLSSDDTADDWGGAGNLINQAAADVFEDVGTDLHLKLSSPAIDAGTNLTGTFTTDADGLTRPSTGDWDMGALLWGDRYYLYRGEGGISEVDFSTPVADIAGGKTSITLTGLGHSANTRYTYVLRPVDELSDATLLETPDVSCLKEFETDGSGDWLGDRPGPIEALSAEVIDSGKIRLRWRYRTPYWGTAPNDFGIYYYTDPDITPGSPDTTESYTADGEYSKDLSLTGGVAYYFALTARNSTPVESHLSEIIGPYIADDTVPATPSLLTSTTF